MDHGELIACGAHQELVQIVGQNDRLTLDICTAAVETAGDELFRRWKEVEGVHQVDAEEGKVILLVQDSNRALPPVLEIANSMGLRILGIEIQEPNLENVFLHLTGRALRD
jgi:ABC-2 type transport system ATP-binding protein